MKPGDLIKNARGIHFMLYSCNVGRINIDDATWFHPSDTALVLEITDYVYVLHDNRRYWTPRYNVDENCEVM